VSRPESGALVAPDIPVGEWFPQAGTPGVAAPIDSCDNGPDLIEDDAGGRWPMTETPVDPDGTADASSTDGAADAAARRRRRTDASPWYWLLLVPIVLLAYPPLYNRMDPELAGLPFFYWYQLAVVPVGVACTTVAYLKTRDQGAAR
jgi:hypothetical protein